MELSTSPNSNVAVPLFKPSKTGQVVAFDDYNKLTILKDGTPLYNWFACITNMASNPSAGYNYQTLAWVEGDAAAVPQNPTCQKVDVVRVFV